MVRVWGLVLVTGCGRIGFDALADAMPFPSPPSCAGLMPTCGPTGTLSCCGSPLVPGGTFYRSHDVAADNAYPDLTSPATVADFRLDTYEVTVGRFRQFVVAGMGTQQSPPPAAAGARTLNGTADQGGWDPMWNAMLKKDTPGLEAAVVNCGNPTWTAAQGANESLPINCILWYEAMAFCVWDGGFLPTEAEWNYAATGGPEQRAYPWSSPASAVTIDCTYANYYDDATSTYCVGAAGGANRVGSESANGGGKWGQADLAGSVEEWTLDAYESPYPTPCDNCAYLAAGIDRVYRGGDALTPSAQVRTARRTHASPSNRSSDFGIRCARSP
jgi:formylglycine-generating enzyme required for sulfatase activity